MDTISISVGDRIVITDAAGREYQTEALGGVEVDGHPFPVIWVKRPLAGGGTDRAPWPATHVRPA